MLRIGIKAKYGFLLNFFSHVSDTYYCHGGVLKQIHPRDPQDVWYYWFLRTGRDICSMSTPAKPRANG